MKITNIDSAWKIQLKLAWAVTANQLDWTVSFYDVTVATGVVLEGTYTGVSNSTTAVDICTAPASGHVRTIKNITVYNADTATAIVILQLVDAWGTRVLIRSSLTTLASWSADDMSYYVDISGKANLASPTFTGTVTLPTTQLGATSMKLAASELSDQTWSGITTTGTGWETLAFGNLCYFKAADSKRYKAKADVTATSWPVMLGICVLAWASTTTEILTYGKIRANSLFPTLTIGWPAFISWATAWEIVTTAPTTAGYVTRIIWYGDTADELFFNADNTYIEHA